MKNGKWELIKDELTSIFDSIEYNVQSKAYLLPIREFHN